MHSRKSHYEQHVRNKYLGYFQACLHDNDIALVYSFLEGRKKNTFQFSEPLSIYSCLSWFDEEEYAPDYVFIDNHDNKPQLILINNSVRLLCLLYDSNYMCEKFFPLFEFPRKGLNYRTFTNSYIAFARVDVLKEPKITAINEDYGINKWWWPFHKSSM